MKPDKTKKQRLQYFFDGQWLPNFDPLRIGAKNFKTLQNMRYVDDGIEGVQGYSKVNTTALTDYTNIRNGHQLRTDRATESYVLVHAEHGTPASNKSRVYQNQTAIGSQGDFQATVLHTDSNYSLDGRFSSGPQGTVVYCNEKESCIWAGNETRMAGFFTVSEVTLSRDDIAINATPNPDTITTVAGNFLTSGFKAGQTVTVSGAATGGNDGDYEIKAIASDGLTITLTDGDLTGDDAAGASTVTLTVSSDAAYVNPVDYSDAVNNDLQTTGNVIDTFGGIDTNTALCLHMDGADESTTFTDSSDTGHTVTATGNAQIDTDQAVFGTGSGMFDGSGDYLSIADAAAWNYGTGKLCIDTRVRFDDVSGLRALYSQESGADHVLLMFDGITDQLVFQVISAGAIVVNEVGSWSPSVSTWYHVAVIRGWGGGANAWAVTVNGATVATFTNSGTLPNIAAALEIGRTTTTTVVDFGATGHVVTCNGTCAVSTSAYKYNRGSVYFDGNSDYLSVPDHADWDILTKTNATVDLWVKHDDHAGVEEYINQMEDVSNFWKLNHTHGSGLGFSVHSGGATVIAISGVGEITDTDWHHIALCKVGNEYGLYKDGVQVGHTSDADTDTFAGALLIGRINGTNYFDGNMEGIRISHTNRFSAAPVAGLTDTITDPTAASAATADDKLLIQGEPKDFDGWMDEYRISKGVARWTAAFSAPSRAYQTYQRKWYLFTTRPAKGFKFYVSEANTDTSTMTGKVWSGRTFSTLTLTDGTSSGGISMAQTGTISFATTEDSAEPWHFEGLYLYAYCLELSAGGCEFYHVTADLGFQDIVDVWDGVYRQPIIFQHYDDSAGYYKDYTLEVNTSSDTSVPIAANLEGMTSSDHVLVGFEQRTSAVLCDLLAGMVNSATSSISVYYWNGTTWVTVGDVTDTTMHETGLKAFSQTGMIAWYPPAESDEAKKTEFGVTGYFYKIEVSATLTGTGASAPELAVDVVMGIPAQYTVKPFKFGSVFKNRVLLCGYTAGNQGNRVDYSVTNAPDAYNGDESSMDGVQSLYFGGSTELTTGTELYNRFGSSIFATWLAMKQSETYLLTGDGPEDYKIYPISYNVGCPAPLTLASAEMGYEMAEDATRNIAIWLSYSGPVIFDGAVLQPLSGIDNYFDPAKSECIKFSIIDRSRGWYDQTNGEYNLEIPSGSSATDCNAWLVYDLKKKRWYEKVPTTYPQAGFPVVDAYGTRYIYGGIDTGYMLQLEDTAKWDTAAIANVWETGDFVTTDNMWDIAKVYYFKTLMKRTDEDLTMKVLHYANTQSSDTTLTRTDISFTETSTIATAAGNFKTTGFKKGQKFTLTGSTSNNATYTISDISVDGKTITVSETSVTTEAAGDTVVMTVDSDWTMDIDSGSDRLVRSTTRMNRRCWSHRFRWEVSAGTGTSAAEKAIKPIGWGIEYDIEREDTGNPA